MMDWTGGVEEGESESKEMGRNLRRVIPPCSRLYYEPQDKYKMEQTSNNPLLFNHRTATV